MCRCALYLEPGLIYRNSYLQFTCEVYFKFLHLHVRLISYLVTS